MFNLLMAPLNQELTIVKIKPGKGLGHSQCCACCSDEDSKDVHDRRLASLGFVEGAKIHVVSESQGNLIVAVKGSKVAIGKGIAKKIMVIPLEK